MCGLGSQQKRYEMERLMDKAIQTLCQALAQKDECETCAAKRAKLNEAGLLKSPMREPELWFNGKAMYSQPKRDWVGLTDVEIRHIEQMNSRSYMEHARAIEAKLRELNT